MGPADMSATANMATRRKFEFISEKFNVVRRCA